MVEIKIMFFCWLIAHDALLPTQTCSGVIHVNRSATPVQQFALPTGGNRSCFLPPLPDQPGHPVRRQKRAHRCQSPINPSRDIYGVARQSPVDGIECHEPGLKLCHLPGHPCEVMEFMVSVFVASPAGHKAMTRIFLGRSSCLIAREKSNKNRFDAA